MPVQEKIHHQSETLKTFSEPALLLNEQGKELCDSTQGHLCGIVEEGVIADEAGKTYNFFIQATDKPYHYLLLSIRHTSPTDYPVRISNTLAGTLTQVHDTETFKRQLHMIFHAPATMHLLEKMKSLAGQ